MGASPLLALSGHELVHRTCPLSGVKRTSLGPRGMSAKLPKAGISCLLRSMFSARTTGTVCANCHCIPGMAMGRVRSDGE